MNILTTSPVSGKRWYKNVQAARVHKRYNLDQNLRFLATLRHIISMPICVAPRRFGILQAGPAEMKQGQEGEGDEWP